MGCPRLLWEAVSQSLLLGFEDDFRHPAVRPPRHFRDSRWPGEGSVLYCPRPLFGWASHLARAVSQCFLMGCDEAFPSQQSGRAVSEAFPSQQVLAFGPGDTASVGPAGLRAWRGQSGGSVATLGGLSPSPFLWVSKVTLGSPAARLPRRCGLAEGSKAEERSRSTLLVFCWFRK